MALVDTAIAISHLRESSDADVGVYLEAAEGRAISFLGRNVYADQPTLDAAVAAGTAGTDPMVVNAEVKVGILMILGSLWNNREAVITGASVAAITVPMGAEAFLWPHRRGLGV
jgi:hypothetical protein